MEEEGLQNRLLARVCAPFFPFSVPTDAERQLPCPEGGGERFRGLTSLISCNNNRLNQIDMPI